jgi:hypothetical protein
MRHVALAAIAIILRTWAVSAREPTLTVVWNDHNAHFPPSALPVLADELHRLFESNGISVRLHVPDDGITPPEPRFNAIVTAAEGVRYRAPRDAMAATIGDHRGHSVFVFLPGISRTLGHDHIDHGPRKLRELSRAIARVLAHELVHVLAPDRPHTATGLMSASLERRQLLRNTIDLDPASVQLVKAKLRKWSEPRTGVAGSSRAGTGLAQ